MKEGFKKQLKAMALEKMNQMIHLLAKEKQMEYGQAIREFADLFMENQSIFQQLYQAYKKKLSYIKLTSNGIAIIYQKEDEFYTITFLNKSFTLEEEPYLFFLTYTIELMRGVLPLGSVVELDPAYFKPGLQTTSPTIIVITGRFIAPAGYDSYFPYSGVVYPLGEIKQGSQIHFTAPLIKRLVHEGFKDEMEEAFVLLMKQDFIFDKGLKSFEFSAHDMKKLQKEMELKEIGGER